MKKLGACKIVVMGTVSLNELVKKHLARAGEVASGRSAVTLYGGAEHHLRQTLIALKAGSGLAEHASPGEATLHVLSGQIVLRSESSSEDLVAGEFTRIPDEVHAVDAINDTAMILTVSKKFSHKV